MAIARNELVADVRAVLIEVLGSDSDPSGVTILQAREGACTAVATVVGHPRCVVKLVGEDAAHPVLFERTAMITGIARATGAPVPEVVAADDSRRRHRWRYLVAEHLDGLPWSELRPLLTPPEVVSVHQQLAEAVRAVQTVRFGGFGEIGAGAEPPTGQSLLTALHQRAESRIPRADDRATFHALLEREAAAFAGVLQATLCHDDLHHGNVLVRPEDGACTVVGLLDWDKAWAGPVEADIARMAFWDDMPGAALWRAVLPDLPDDPDAQRRVLVHQLLWCFEYASVTPRHVADTDRLRRLLRLS